MIARVFHQKHITRFCGNAWCGKPISEHKFDLMAKRLFQGSGDRLKRHFGHNFSFGPIKMCKNNNCSPFFQKLLQCWHNAVDAGCVCHHSIGNWHIQIEPYDNAFSSYINVIKGVECWHEWLLISIYEVRTSTGALKQEADVAFIFNLLWNDIRQVMRLLYRQRV